VRAPPPGASSASRWRLEKSAGVGRARAARRAARAPPPTGGAAASRPGAKRRSPGAAPADSSSRAAPASERLVVTPQGLGEPVEVRDDPGVVVTLDQGEQLAAHAVAQVAPRAVAAVRAPGHPARREPGLDLGAPRAEEGMHEQPAVARGGMPPRPAGPAPRDEAHQERLGLIVGGVREGDARAAVAAPDAAGSRAAAPAPAPAPRRAAARPGRRGARGRDGSAARVCARHAPPPRRRAPRRGRADGG